MQRRSHADMGTIRGEIYVVFVAANPMTVRRVLNLQEYVTLWHTPEGIEVMG
jgi:hypothetical protein